MSKMLSLITFALTLMVLGPVARAADYYGEPPRVQTPAPGAARAQPPASYGEGVGMKAASGLANMTLGWVELPKNMINTSNQVNVALGVTGGVLKGLLHTVGRTVGGVVDLLTSPFPARPLVQPPFVWENFDMETTYGPAFKLQD